MSASNGSDDTEGVNIKVRVPKRVLHFSDGVLEEFSDDDDEVDSRTDNETAECTTIIDPKQMSWGPWFMYKAVKTGATALSVCDYIGEALANFLGITTPKYQYELDEFERMEKERLEREAKAEGWSLPTVRTSNDPTTAQPTTTI